MNSLDIRPELIDEDLLPQSLQELSEVIGLDAALKLAAAYPGVPLYIPAKFNHHHTIARLIGTTAFSALVEQYQGETLKLPKVDSALRQIKHEMRRRMRHAGKSNREIALALNYTQRHVERLGERDRCDLQSDLFRED